MPVYDYICECGKEVSDYYQPSTKAINCPKCGRPMNKKAVSIQLSGFDKYGRSIKKKENRK